MIDLIKKTLLAGVGATVVTAERLESALQEYVKQGKVSAGDAKTLAAKIADDGRREFETVSTDLSGRVKELLARADFAHRSRVDALEARVRALEEQVARLTVETTHRG